MKRLFPTVSVIVLSFNGETYLTGCLSSLADQDYDDFEVIVVDNGSTDGSGSLVETSFPEIKLIELDRNLGFAGGNAAGFKEARGEVIVLLNQDTVARRDWLRSLMQAMSDDRAIGIAGCKILDPDGKTIQHVGGLIGDNALTNHLGHGEEDGGQWAGLIDVDYVTGAAMAIRRQVVERCGFLDGGYFPAYFEEAELCCRARRAGFRVVCVPAAAVIHFESSSTGKFTSSFFYYYHKNRLRFVLRNYALKEIVSRFAIAEIAWLRRSLPRDQVGPLRKAYAFNLVRLVPTLVMRNRVR